MRINIEKEVVSEAFEKLLFFATVLRIKEILNCLFSQ